MRFHRLDLNLLVALDVLLDEKSISKAGDRLHLTQSATSDALGRLREFFEDELLIRVGAKMALTPLAEELIEPVREVLVRIKGTIMDRPRFEPATCTRNFKLLVSGFSLVVLVPALLQKVQAEAPNVRFELNLQRHQPLQVLDRADIDLMIMPDGFVSPNHPHEILFEDSYTCVVWDQNSNIGDALSLQDYLDAGHVAMHIEGADGNGPGSEEWLLRQSGIERRVEVMAASLAALPALVVGTNRIATLQTRLARWAQDKFPVRLLEPPIPTPTAAQGIQWHRSKTCDPALTWLRGTLSEVVASLP